VDEPANEIRHADATQALEARVTVLEEHMRRLLLIVGAAGTMLSEV
jgi:hypothetical protein